MKKIKSLVARLKRWGIRGKIFIDQNGITHIPPGVYKVNGTMLLEIGDMISGVTLPLNPQPNRHSSICERRK
jgi:hypothetical protein